MDHEKLSILLSKVSEDREKNPNNLIASPPARKDSDYREQQKGVLSMDSTIIVVALICAAFVAVGQVVLRWSLIGIVALCIGYCYAPRETERYVTQGITTATQFISENGGQYLETIREWTTQS